jgi:hypothetical protein
MNKFFTNFIVKNFAATPYYHRLHHTGSTAQVCVVGYLSMHSKVIYTIHSLYHTHVPLYYHDSNTHIDATVDFSSLGTFNWAKYLRLYLGKLYNKPNQSLWSTCGVMVCS